MDQIPNLTGLKGHLHFYNGSELSRQMRGGREKQLQRVPLLVFLWIKADLQSRKTLISHLVSLPTKYICKGYLSVIVEL